MQLQEFSRWSPAIWGQCALDEWHDRLQSVCGRFHPSLCEEGMPVTGDVTLIGGAGIEIAHVATDVNEVRRTRDDIRKEFGEHFFLLVQLEGVCGIEQQGRQSLIASGDCILVDSSLPSNFHFNGRFSNQLSVHLPRQLLLAQKPNELEISHRLPAQDPMATMLRAVVAKILQTSSAHSRAGELRQLLFQATRQAFAVDGPGDFVPKDRSCGRFELAQILVDRHLTEERLTPQWLARRLGVSLRTLQEDFSTLGATATSFIRDRRLRLARDRLAEMQRGAHSPTIADIALASGFNDISYFNRCFKKAFDCSPKDVTRS